MSLGIKRNDINDSTDDHIVLQFLKDFKAVKCLYCFQEDKKFLCQCKNCGYYFCNNFHRKASHIFIHLKQCDHEKVALNPFPEVLIGSNSAHFSPELTLPLVLITLTEFPTLIKLSKLKSTFLSVP